MAPKIPAAAARASAVHATLEVMLPKSSQSPSFGHCLEKLMLTPPARSSWPHWKNSEPIWSSAFSQLQTFSKKFCSFWIASLTACMMAALYARSEEHTSELQSRENLVC